MVINEVTKAILNSIQEGIVIIDSEGVITFANTAYSMFLHETTGISVHEIEGKELTSLRKGAMLPNVFITGKPETYVERNEEDEVYFANMYPIYRDDAVIGGISVVTFEEGVAAFREKLKEAERRSRLVLYKVNEDSHAQITFDSIVSRSSRSKECKELAKKIAASDSPILLTAEPGSGKHIYARAIHNESSRKNNVFITLDCTAFSSKELETELFGCIDHEPGKIGNQEKTVKMGLLEAAQGGTLLLDEISEASLDIQSKLRKVLHEQKIRPVGSGEEIAVDVRIIASSSVDLKERVVSGSFRPDLYYDLSTFNINIPSLRERIEDLPLLANQILEEMSVRLKKRLAITDDALECLMLHEWSGNIRELKNVLEFSAYVSVGGRITLVDLPENIVKTSERNTMPLYDRVRNFEKKEILSTLKYYSDDLNGKKAAAKELGISLASLYTKIK